LALVAEPFFCLAAAASGGSRHLAGCACASEIFLRIQNHRLTPPFLFPSIASNSIPKYLFCIVDFFSAFIPHQPPRRHAAKRFAPKEQPAAESWLLCQKPVYEFTIISSLLEYHIEDCSLLE
jgi:hypothetical protein